MKETLTILFCLCLSQTFGQNNKKISAYLLTQYNKTLYDQTLGNNPWGLGFGLQAFFDNKTRFKPTIELTGDFYLEDDKIFRMDPNDKPLNDLGFVTNLFAGTSYYPTENFYLSIATGPSFSSGRTLIGIKPSLGFNFPKNQRWITKLSYINIFNRGQAKEDFGTLSLSIGVKLF